MIFFIVIRAKQGAAAPGVLLLCLPWSIYIFVIYAFPFYWAKWNFNKVFSYTVKLILDYFLAVAYI